MHPNSPDQLTMKSSTPANTWNVGFYGMAQLTGGLVQITQINGHGLLTKGFVWQLPELWFDPQSMDGVATGWTAALGYTGSASVLATGWTAAIGYAGSASVISTAWTLASDFAMNEAGPY